MSRDWKSWCCRAARSVMFILAAAAVVWKGDFTSGTFVEGVLPSVMYSVLAGFLLFTGVAFAMRADEISIFHDSMDEAQSG